MTTGLDRTRPIMLIVLLLVSHFNFFVVPCSGLSWLPVSFLLHVKYTLSDRIRAACNYLRMLIISIMVWRILSLLLVCLSVWSV